MFEKFKHYNPELEDVIIGACLLEGSAFSRVFDLLKPEMFYSGENQAIFSAIYEMFEENLPVDLITVFSYLVKKKGVTNFNGEPTAYTVTKKINSVVSTAHLEYHALIVKQMWLEREIIIITSSGVDKNLDGLEQLNTLQERLRELTSVTAVNDWQDMTQLMVGLYKHQDEMLRTKGIGIPSGFKTIDRLYGGFYPGQMIVIASRPSVGKSAFCGGIAINMAAQGFKVGVVSLEMNNNEIAARLASLDSEISFASIFRGLYDDERDRQKLFDRINNSTGHLPIYVTDATDVNVTDIKAKAYKLKQKKGLDCLIIDYLQLVGSDNNRNRTRENDVAKISRGFKIIAKELGVPVIVLAQLNREVEKRKGKDRFPQLSDLRESGAIEQDGDAVMFLHSDFKSGLVEDEQGQSTEKKAHLVIRKWRNGKSNIIIDMDFDGPTMKFSEKEHTPSFSIPSETNYNNQNPF